jgi:hypothetical protein
MESEEPTDQAGEEHLAGPFHTSFGEKTSRSQIQNRRSPVCASSAEGRPTGRPARISASPPRLVNTVRGGAAKGRRPSTRIIAQGHSAEIGPIDSESAQRMDNTPRPNPPVEKDWAGPPHPCGQDGGDPSRHRRPRSGADTRDVSPDRASNSPRSPRRTGLGVKRSRVQIPAARPAGLGRWRSRTREAISFSTAKPSASCPPVGA